ncbi:MAG: DUF167 domain-containing protein [Woeseiaceae bacterium]|nr:DUF167 domain-containing protein [Woeseiaceae bacterium]
MSVRVHPRARHDEVVGVKDGHLHIRTTVPPTDGKANKAVTRMLADYLKIAPSRLTLLRGDSQRNKQFLIRV